MARRQLVPTALHNELTEYSSLLRALRTTQTLDVTAHLTQSQGPTDDEHDVSESEEETTPAASTSIQKRKPSQSEPGSPHWRNRDQWTRWPIPVKDVPPPDWSLQEEVEAIVKQVLASIEPDSDSEAAVKHEEDVESQHDGDNDDEDAYMHHLAELVTSVVENQLESIFALICAHTMARPDSMQNRIEPFDWHDLLNILSSPMAAHLVDETILQNLTTRMQVLYDTTPVSTSATLHPPSPVTALHRQSLVHSSRSKLNNRLSKHTALLFEQTLPSSNDKYLTLNQLTKKNKRKAEKKSRRDTESAEDNEQEDAGLRMEGGVLRIQSSDDSEWDGLS